MSSWEKKEDKVQQSVSNSDNAVNNILNAPNNTAALPTAPFPPSMYYYQPFRPPVNPMMGFPLGSPGYGGYMPPNIVGYASPNGVGYSPINTPAYLPGYSPFETVSMNMGYNQMPNNYSNSYQVPQTQQIPLNLAQNISQKLRTQNQQPVRNQKPLQQPVKKSVQPMAQQSQKKHHIIPVPPISSEIANYNLDDPEELEKWKAERRKKFPVAKKDDEKTADIVNITKEFDDNEEGEVEINIEDKNVVISQKRKKFCRYFSRGKCNKGDSCQFEHVAKAKKPKSENVSKNEGSRSTIFENLMRNEEKESMIKFYECIKLLIRQ